MTQPDPRLWANVCANPNCRQPQNADFAEHGIHAPMIHAGAPGTTVTSMTGEQIESHHLDCMPAELEAQHRDQHGAAIDAAKAGVRGHALHEVIHRGAAESAKLEATFLEATKHADSATLTSHEHAAHAAAVQSALDRAENHLQMAEHHAGLAAAKGSAK